ncbi:unnamed protein product [Prorocentrum cordatum]|uniref:RRM domain-containing protein n=1 Tax=Prorocentrum cordatum TaxID=2364126 RepID=A0ABN9UQL1_9DINO|nr:unnamed protein product [Polarella glacialis]
MAQMLLVDEEAGAGLAWLDPQKRAEFAQLSARLARAPGPGAAQPEPRHAELRRARQVYGCALEQLRQRRGTGGTWQVRVLTTLRQALAAIDRLLPAQQQPPPPQRSALPHGPQETVLARKNLGHGLFQLPLASLDEGQQQRQNLLLKEHELHAVWVGNLPACNSQQNLQSLQNVVCHLFNEAGTIQYIDMPVGGHVCVLGFETAQEAQKAVVTFNEHRFMFDLPPWQALTVLLKKGATLIRVEKAAITSSLPGCSSLTASSTGASQPAATGGGTVAAPVQEQPQRIVNAASPRRHAAEGLAAEPMAAGTSEPPSWGPRQLPRPLPKKLPCAARSSTPLRERAPLPEPAAPAVAGARCPVTPTRQRAPLPQPTSAAGGAAAGPSRGGDPEAKAQPAPSSALATPSAPTPSSAPALSCASAAAGPAPRGALPAASAALALPSAPAPSSAPRRHSGSAGGAVVGAAKPHKRSPAAAAAGPAPPDELRRWLDGLDKGKGALLAYAEALEREFEGSLVQIQACLLEGATATSSALSCVDGAFFEAIGCRMFGHRLLLASGIKKLAGLVQ